jgi:hypothetical protein
MVNFYRLFGGDFCYFTVHIFLNYPVGGEGKWCRSWFRLQATNQKVAGSISDGVVHIFYWLNSFGRTMAVGSSSLKKQHQGYLLEGKSGLCDGLATLTPSCVSSSRSPKGLSRLAQGYLYLQLLTWRWNQKSPQKLTFVKAAWKLQISRGISTLFLLPALSLKGNRIRRSRLLDSIHEGLLFGEVASSSDPIYKPENLTMTIRDSSQCTTWNVFNRGEYVPENRKVERKKHRTQH